MSLSLKTNVHYWYTQNETQVPNSNYILTGADLQLNINTDIETESFLFIRCLVQ